MVTKSQLNCVYIQLVIMRFIPITARVGITGFESPASDYLQLPLSLDSLLVEHPSVTFIGKADCQSMEGVGIASAKAREQKSLCVAH